MKLFIMTGLAALLSACSTSATDQQSASLAEETVRDVPRAGLPPQTLAPGECGLFLWSRRQSPEFMFFSRVPEDSALLWLDDKAEPLNRTGLGGDTFYQQLTEQNFTLGDGRVVELRMVPGETLEGGQRVPEASLNITNAEGFQTIIPAAGVSVCQPE